MAPLAALTYARFADTLILVLEPRVQANRAPLEGETMEGSDRHWRGSPLDVADSSIDAYGIENIVIEFDNGDEDVLRPKQRGEFGSYELHQMAAYLDSMAHSIRKGKRN